MFKDREHGAVAPFIALMLFVIIICIALVVDLGHVHNVKAELQRAVDAAALAGAKQLPETVDVVAMATATAGTNRVGGYTFESLLTEKPDSTAIDIVLGNWDTEDLTSDASVRFVTGGTNPDAVYVKATHDVEHIFFFFTNATTVIADAIALAKPYYPILPLAVVSCIPTDEEPGTLPEMNVCGVVGHEFSSDPDDLAAWSSLTFGPASATNILDILEAEDGEFDRFNQVVFGRGLNYTDGIENDPVSSSRPGSFSFDKDYAGCVNDGLNINCGLGKIIDDKDIAPPDDFSPPPDIPLLNTASHPSGNTYYSGDTGFDPLADYPILPRWYNISDNTGFDEEDHFIRVVTQDGILIKGPTETPAEYTQRLIDLNTGVLRPYGPTDERFIEFIDIHDKPDFLSVARYAGYPRVHVMNGVTKPVLEAFLMRLYDTNDKKDIKDPLPCTDNAPFPEGEKSVRINVPVIFAGDCDNWKAVDSSKFAYIGMAKLLMTRAEVANIMYACPDDDRAYAGSCGETFTPPLDGTGKFGLVTYNAPTLIEGLYTLPTTDDDDDEGGLVEYFLVE